MATNPRPNILWISFEDTSPRFGCYGDPLAQTPNVDRFAGYYCTNNIITDYQFKPSFTA